MGEGPQLPHKSGQEWDSPHIARVRQVRSDGKSATDVHKELGVPPRTQRRMLKNNPRLGDRAIGQVFEVSEEKVLLRGNVGGTSDDRECLGHYSVFSQRFFISLLKGFKYGLEEARGGKRRP